MDSLPGRLEVTTDAPVAPRLGGFAAALRPGDVPAEAMAQAKGHMRDALEIGIAASGFEFAQRGAMAIAGLAGEGSHPAIGLPLPLRGAVLRDGTLIHGHDHDATHSDASVHASASAVPTTRRMARRHGASGCQALLTDLLGVEASARVGAAAQGGSHQVGFHLPGSAVALARGGFRALPAPAEDRFGPVRSHLRAKAPADLSRCAEALGVAWQMRKVALTPYPFRHFNHVFADAALAPRTASLPRRSRPSPAASARARPGRSASPRPRSPAPPMATTRGSACTAPWPQPSRTVASHRTRWVTRRSTIHGCAR
jgi:hypothetical protein